MNLQYCVSTSFHFPKSFVTYSCNTINVIITHSLSCLFIFFHSFWTLRVPLLPSHPATFFLLFLFSLIRYRVTDLTHFHKSNSTSQTDPPHSHWLRRQPLRLFFLLILSNSAEWSVAFSIYMLWFSFLGDFETDWSSFQTMWICRHQGIAFWSPFGHDHWAIASKRIKAFNFGFCTIMRIRVAN